MHLSIKIFYTLFVAVLLPVYWLQYGPGNFFWFSDIALFVMLIAAWTESRFLTNTMAVGVLAVELAWHVDLLIQLVTGTSIMGIADYMFDASIPLLVRGLSLFHVGLVAIILWLLYRRGYDRRGLPAMTVLAWLVLPATYLLTSPEKNTNWVYGWSDRPQNLMPPGLYVLTLMILFPLAIYLPTHWLLRRWFGRQLEPGPGRGPAGGWWKAAPLAATCAAAALLGGCGGARLIPPANVAEPVTVYLLDHGRTPSLVLPTPRGDMVRYVYGDWKWYALHQRNLGQAFPALLLPTQGTLGRQAMSGPISEANVRAQVPYGIEHLHALPVERQRALALQQQLEEQFAAYADTAVRGEGDMTFVHAPQRYTYFHNSNHRVAQWLRALGVEVRGPAFQSNWRVTANAR